MTQCAQQVPTGCCNDSPGQRLAVGQIWQGMPALHWHSAVVLLALQEEPDWATAKRVLGQPKFIERLMTYDADNIPDIVLDGLQRIVTDPRFTADQVRSVHVWSTSVTAHAS